MIRVILHSLLALMLMAAVAVGDSDAGRESLFSLGAGARALGMGGTFTSIANDASSVYYNPAGMTRLDYQELTFMHATLFEGTSYNLASWAIPISEQNGIGVGFLRVGTDDIIGRENFIVTDTFDYSQSQVVFSYGHELLQNWSAGINFKIVNQSVGQLSDYGYGIDIGLAGDLFDHLSIGVIGRDLLAPEIKLDSAGESGPWSVTGGLSLHNVALSEHASITAAIELEKTEDRNLKIHAGSELVFYGAYALRAGFDRDNFALGAGVRIKKLKFDYAYRMLDYVDNSHRFSLSILVGPSISDRGQIQYVQTPPPELSEDERTFLRLKTAGDGFFRQFEFDSALVYYDQALAYDPANSEILETVAAIEKARLADREQQAKLQNAEQEVSQFVERYYNQAALFYAKKYYPAATDLLELIFEIDPDHQKALALKEEIEAARSAEISRLMRDAATAEQQGRMIEAIEAYNRVLDLDPDNQAMRDAKRRSLASLDVQQQLNLGIQLYTQGRYEAARVRFNEVLASNPGQPVALEYLKNISEAQADVSTLEDLQRDRAIWNLYLDGIRYMRNNDYSRAIEAWEKVLEAYPNNVNTLNNLEQARLRLESEASQ